MKKRLPGMLIALFLLSCPLLSAAISVVGELTHEFSAEAGEIIAGSIVVQNSGLGAEDVKLYQTDYTSSAGGYHYYLDPNTTPRSNASWITVSSTRFTIPAGETYTVPYTLAVPKDKTLDGTYWSMFMVEAIPKESPESAAFDPEKITVGIRTVLRYGIRIVTHLGRAVLVPPDIVKTAVISEEDKRLLKVDVSNPGTRLLRITLWAELYTEEGEYTGSYPGGERQAVFPGSSLTFTVDLSEVPKNKYLALVVMDCGNNDVYGAHYTLVFE